jgi:hypothetical protein
LDRISLKRNFKLDVEAEAKAAAKRQDLSDPLIKTTWILSDVIFFLN